MLIYIRRQPLHDPSSTYHPDLRASHMIIDVDMTDSDIPIVIYVYHRMILFIAISWLSMKICVCALVNISQWTTHIRHIYERCTDNLLCSTELVPLSMLRIFLASDSFRVSQCWKLSSVLSSEAGVILSSELW